MSTLREEGVWPTKCRWSVAYAELRDATRCPAASRQRCDRRGSGRRGPIADGAGRRLRPRPVGGRRGGGRRRAPSLTNRAGRAVRGPGSWSSAGGDRPAPRSPPVGAARAGQGGWVPSGRVRAHSVATPSRRLWRARPARPSSSVRSPSSPVRRAASRSTSWPSSTMPRPTAHSSSMGWRGSPDRFVPARLGDLVEGRLAACDPQVRRTIELVATTNGLPLDVLRAVGGRSAGPAGRDGGAARGAAVRR